MSRPAFVALLAVASVSCSTGMTAAKFRPAQEPSGVVAHINTIEVELTGELLEVRANGLVLLSRSSVARLTSTTPMPELVVRLIPFERVRSSTFEQMDPQAVISGGVAPNPKIRERLRLVSRFPYGISPEVLSHLLSHYGQAEIAGIRP